MKIKVSTFFILFPLLFTTPLEARYRAYKLSILDAVSGEKYQVITTLPPQVYLMYYETNRSFRQTTVVGTWMCWGNTSHLKPICPDPRDEENNIEIKPDKENNLAFQSFYDKFMFLQSSF